MPPGAGFHPLMENDGNLYTLLGAALPIVALVIVFTANHWGPGLQRLLFAIADRISGGHQDGATPNSQPTPQTWIARILAVLVSLALICAGVWAAIQVVDRFV